MSQTPNRTRHATTTTFVGLPTGSAIGINFAALFTGALIAVWTGSIGWPLLALFAAAVIITTTVVNPRGIYLTVVTAPLLFFISVIAVGYLLSRDQLSTGGTSSRTAQLLVVYPLVELFPVLAAVTLGAIIIGWVRIRLIKRQNDALLERETAERSRASESNRRTNIEGRRARERSRAVSVQELVSRERDRSGRARSAHGGSTRVVNRLGDDLYSE
ncbi:hypothetical protein CGLAUT_04370 [Corynebacterium glaucum]|uniref:DUF6542 domain-containing protein n=1 Tax=Corynebacterium glaucum TaxID=187491 RepID=UPI0025B2A8B5|nr:DUF6542 domain-containing protein [Corynebacterium glaucum]WJZ07372.1 hypothetical protein CGLAUT_04370 [Corynebacterium glaucum]